MKFNEEYIKNNIIMPLLKNAGFGEGQLEFEKSFSVQLGRGVYNVKNDEAKKANGYLDILCKLDGKNLFVIELKAEKIELTEKDKIQGLSYARLLQPMAPFVLLTNGEDYNVFDTYTGNPINKLHKEYFINGYFPSLDEEINLRFQALKNFIGYSYDNLINLFNTNNKKTLSKFCSNSAEELNQQINYKYIPSLYVNRANIEDRFSQFLLQKRKWVFPIIGKSGVGKTNLICYLAEKYSSEPCLYYSGSILTKSFLKELADDFNLVFSAVESELGILKKISMISNMHNKNFIIFIDALDEWIAEDKVSQINKLSKYCSMLNIRLCISCKNSIWNTFLKRNGVNTELIDNLFCNVLELKEFSNDELDNAIIKCSKVLGIETDLETREHNIISPCRLRIACEVSYHDNIPLKLSLGSRKALTRYIEMKLEKSSNSNIIYRYLDSISKYMLENNQIQVKEEEIRSYLKLSINEDLPIDLFNFNFLYRYIDESGKAYIGFYFSEIRDFLVSIRVLELRNIRDSTKTNKIIKALDSTIGEYGVYYFFKTGSLLEQRECIEAIIQYDNLTSKNMLARLLSWYGIYLNKDTFKSINMYYKTAINLKQVFELYKHSRVIARQVVKSFEILSKSFDIENELIDLLKLLFKHSNDDFVFSSHLISELLMKYDNKENTDKLVDMLMNEENDSYIRRYIIEGISKRIEFNKKSVFLRLLINKDADLRSYVKCWYSELEDIQLRNTLLEIFDDNNHSYIRVSIALTLAESKLGDTAEQLFIRLMNYSFDELTTSWLCRSVSALKYTKAISKFIEILRSSLNSELGGHILLSLEELQAKECLPVILELLPNAGQEFRDWFPHFLINIASEEDYEELMNLAFKANNEDVMICAITTFCRAGNKNYNDIVFKYIMDKEVPMIKRVAILQTWGDATINEQIFFKQKNKDKEFTKIVSYEELNKQCINNIYLLLDENSEMSSIALAILLCVEQDYEKLYGRFIEFLPKHNIKFSTRKILMPYNRNLQNFSQYIRPWLNTQLNSANQSKIFIENCLVFCGFFGNKTTVEVINTNRENLITLVDRSFLEFIENEIFKCENNEPYVFLY